ncbi:hypothetical protein GGI23_002886 [Coemansia sp. RSA 2559]|nr:hypothetical protein GGI23_002886 [Coemansia sp. RSA 2559]KAJ2866727.1 hypothetical protein GGI22_001217 [Coemansia erecta]
MVPNLTIDMGDFLPATPAKRRVTGDTQFMFQFYKACIHFYAPNERTALCMGEAALYQSLMAALRECPLLFGRLKVHDEDKSVWLEYDPADSNAPTIEFQYLDTTYEYLEQHKFAYSAAQQRGLDMPVPDGTIFRGEHDKPMLAVKVSYLADGGVAIFSMSHHVAFDGNAVFSFLSHWATCTRRIRDLRADRMAVPSDPQADRTAVPSDLQVFATSLVSNTENRPTEGPAEISVAPDMSPQEIKAMTNRLPSPEGTQACVFSISTASLAQLHSLVKNSGVLAPDEWVSSNNVLAAFVAQCVARASTEAQVYAAGDWVIFQAMDMRRPLGLALQGLGSPLMLAQCQMPYAEIEGSPTQFASVAKRVRQSIGRYTGDYLQQAMDWMHCTYRQMAQRGVDEPWRRFWFTALDTNRRAVGLSFMNRIPVYGADFGAGRPAMAMSCNPRANYVIVFPGPPSADNGARSRDDYSELHLYVTLEKRAMDALVADRSWAALCTLVSKP